MLKTPKCITSGWLMLATLQVSVPSLLETSDLTAMPCFDLRDGNLGLTWLEKCGVAANRQPSVRNGTILGKPVIPVCPALLVSIPPTEKALTVSSVKYDRHPRLYN